MSFLKRHEREYIKRNTDESKMLLGEKYEVFVKAIHRYNTSFTNKIQFAAEPDHYGIGVAKWRS
jgi:hypothetical protein